MSKYFIFALVFLVAAIFAEMALLAQGGHEVSYALNSFEMAPRPFKTLVIGHCESASGIAPSYLGKNAFNFAMNDINFYYTRKLLEQEIDKTEVESVVLAVNSLMLVSRYKVPTYTQRYLWLMKGILPPKEELVSTAFTFGNHAKLFNDKLNEYFFEDKVPFNHHLRFSSEVTSVPLANIRQDTLYRDGFRALTPSYFSEEVKKAFDEHIERFELSKNDSETEELMKILSILKNSSIKTTVLLLPQVEGHQELVERRMPGTEKKLQDTLAEIRKQYHNVRIYDLRKNHGIPDHMFALPNIISSKGADILGPQIAKLLNEQQH